MSKRVGDWEEGKKGGGLGREGKIFFPFALFSHFPSLIAPATQSIIPSKAGGSISSHHDLTDVFC